MSPPTVFVGASLGTENNTKRFGNLTARFEDYDEKFAEFNTPVTLSMKVGVTDESYDSVVSKLKAFGEQINEAQIPYSMFSTNSNASAHQALEELGFSRTPHPAAGMAIGSRTVLPLP